MRSAGARSVDQSAGSSEKGAWEMSEQVGPRRQGRIYARGKRGVLWIAWYADGRECRESTKSTNYRVAERKLRDKLAAKDRGETYVPGAQRVTVGRLTEMLGEHHEAAGTKSRQRIAQ